MKQAAVIARREFRAYFDSPIAYVVLITFGLISGFVFFSFFFRGGVASMRALFDPLPLYFVVLVPLITMRLWSEERGTGTEELLLTFPLRIRDAVIGKFAAAWGLLAVALLLTLPIALTVASLAAAGSDGGGGLDWGPVWGGYLTAFLMGGAYLAIGLFTSAFTKHQIVAALITITILGLLWGIGEKMVLDFFLPSKISDAILNITKPISLGWHFGAASRGSIEFRDVDYYLTVMGLFLSLNGVVVDARRWR
ncbi:MAG: ABC transporter permease subunit [Planctomycetes bacterium]|nr:ABC transporter permease subunit [Planctomycetota bacterium]